MTASRLFSLDQGSLRVVLPEGFGIPLMSDQLVSFNTQVLNHNVRRARPCVQSRRRGGHPRYRLSDAEGKSFSSF